MKKLVIFDLDGTLLNSIYAIANATNKALEFFNLKTYDVEEYNNFVGGGLRQLVELIVDKEKYTIKSEDIVEKLLEIYQIEYGYNLVEYEGIEKLLSYLDEKNIKYAIITNKDQDLAEKSVEITPLSKYNFYKIIGVDPLNIEDKKPNPVNVDRLIEELKIDRKDVLFVGDMLVDYNTAKNADIDFAYCNWGFGNIKGEKGIDSKYKFNKVEEIIERFL